MTVIAYRKGVVVADRMMTDGDFVLEVEKLFTHEIEGEAFVVGSAGDWARSIRFRAWLAAGMVGKVPSLKGVEVMAVSRRDRHVETWGIVDGELFRDHRVDTFYAIGSGYGFAMGAMRFGATAKAAVEYACERRNDCGNGLQVVKV